jgi:hypothetical protein
MQFEDVRVPAAAMPASRIGISADRRHLYDQQCLLCTSKLRNKALSSC